jgi:ribosome biogenesis GTPase
MQRGRVIQSTGSWYLVDTKDEIVESRLPGHFRLIKKEMINPITVGNFVDFSVNDDCTGTIESIETRDNQD